eukprot:scaffold34501_cov38-Tisochrysis_lutea.AAC.3
MHHATQTLHSLLVFCQLPAANFRNRFSHSHSYSTAPHRYALDGVAGSRHPAGGWVACNDIEHSCYVLLLVVFYTMRGLTSTSWLPLLELRVV